MRGALVVGLTVCLGVVHGQQQTNATGGYKGPAVLSRVGQPIGKYLGQPILFRFHAGVHGTYSTGITQPATDTEGRLTERDAYGGRAQIGVYGARHGKHDTLAADFLAGYRAYFGHGNQTHNGLDLSAGLNYSRQASHRTAYQLSLHGQSYGYSQGGLYQPTVVSPFFDVADPTVDGFDGRTSAVSGVAGVSHMLSQRWRTVFSGGGYYANRRTRSLIDSQGWMTSGSAQYLVNATTSIGPGYRFSNFVSTGGYGESWSHTFFAGLSKQFSEQWSFGADVGAFYVQFDRLRSVPLEPVLAAIIGQRTTLEPVFTERWGPSVAATLARRFERSSLSFYVRHGIHPGNAFMATAENTSGGVRYSYTATDRLNTGVHFRYTRRESVDNLQFAYDAYGGGAGVSYRITRVLHLTGSVHYFTYATTGDTFNRNRFRASVGFSFSPGDLPLALF